MTIYLDVLLEMAFIFIADYGYRNGSRQSLGNLFQFGLLIYDRTI